MAKTVWVDKGACVGCGTCVDICPGVFRMDADDKAEVFDPAGATETEIEDAIDACPVSCIEWK